MSAHLYITMTDVPDGARRGLIERRDDETGDTLVSYLQCPVTGRVVASGEIEFPFPRSLEIRQWLEFWLEYWGIPWRVLP
ncbi:hypothetical protein [Burkholderia pyrrocinia]|uniref:hypothetical protein n=1 Tax=Burkholderia pyrrocinia TaxID=60550 RepID=UPI002AB0188C|nr:hypothetical protein [Burkholderia pyrrocinia]